MSSVSDLVNLSRVVDVLADKAQISDNPSENPLVDAYNKGVWAMQNQIKNYLNEMALGKAFGGEDNG